MTFDQIPVFCMSMPGPRRDACAIRLKDQGVNFQFFDGFEGLKAGLLTRHPYGVDNPDEGYMMSPRQIGNIMSHIILWQSLQVAVNAGWTTAPAFMVLEDDADFLPNWRDKIEVALGILGDDWDYLAPGSCDCGQPSEVVRRGLHLYETRPLCTHCYIIHARALPIVINSLKRIWAPIDLALYYDAFPKMKVFTILPRCVDQVGTPLNP